MTQHRDLSSNLLNDMAEKFYPVKKNGKYAFIDKQGNLITKFDFDFANMFGGIKVKEEFGYMDGKGTIHISPNYRYEYGFGGFNDGLAIVEVDGKFGFINSENDIVIEPKYYRVNEFHNGIALVQDNMLTSAYFINTSGKTILNNREFGVSEYNEGLINCKSLIEKKWGFVDMDNNFIIPPIYDYTSSFHEGLAAVIPTLIGKKANKKQLFGFVNRNNEVLIPPNFNIANGHFSEGLCCIWDNGNGYMDTKGEVVIPCEYLVGENFSDGLASVQLKKNNKHGFINRDGNMVIKPKFEHVERFENGIAKVTIGKDHAVYKEGYINKDGEYIWKPTR